MNQHAPTRHAVVTGGAGFLGVHLTALLLDRGWAVTVLDTAGQLAANCALDDRPVERVVVDVTDPASLAGRFDGADVVFHLAAVVAADAHPEHMRAVNVDGTVNVLTEAASAGVPVVHTASIAALGSTPDDGSACDETYFPDAPGSFAYARTKRDGLLAALDAAARGQSVRIVCPGGIYAPDDDKTLSLAKQVMAFTRLGVPVFAPGDVYQGPVHADDVADALLRVAEDGRDGEIYLAVGDPMPFEELLAAVYTAEGKRPPRCFPASSLARLDPVVARAAQLAGDRAPVADYWALTRENNANYSNAKARGELGWSPRSWDEGVQELLAADAGRPSAGRVPTWSWGLVGMMAVLGASTRAGALTDRLLPLTTTTRRWIFAAAVATHCVEAGFTWRATPNLPPSSRTWAVTRSVLMGGPSLVAASRAARAAATATTS
ncbi:MAG: NAD-dependent epimerase/dehydratase family protein [Acidimicrobiales bacterium]|jgi:UDP-glucose 4-epimerase|nr:NAD-dependent epimerase/dehydratase family protein [Acidimicrobiales bacterium]